MDSTVESKEMNAYEQDNMEDDEENTHTLAKSGAHYGALINHQGIYKDVGTAQRNERILKYEDHSARTKIHQSRTTAQTPAVSTHIYGKERTREVPEPNDSTPVMRNTHQIPDGRGNTEDTGKTVSLTSNDSSDEKHEYFLQQKFVNSTNVMDQPSSYQYETNTLNEDHHQPDRAENRGTELSSTLIQPFQEDEICGMKKKYYGTKSDKKEKVIILLGATGSGKTTLVNFIANYFQGNKKADDELGHVAWCSNDDHSLTKTITAYTFCDHQDHTPITVIDTPGLDDSSGAEIRDHVLSIKTFLANITSHDYEIHAIGFVAQAHLVRLTTSERLVMDYVSTLFGEASGGHILTFITFGDSQSNPPVVEAMAYYGVKCKHFFKFNNSVLTMKTGDEIDVLDQVYWNMGNKSWKKCMKVLKEMPPLSVHTMKTLQNSVFVSQVYDSVKKNLKSELKAFINTTNIHKGLMHADAINVCESVWQLAIVVNYYSNKQSNKTPFVETLLHYTQEVCQEARANEYNCVRLLSFAPSRDLVMKGVALLEYNAPVYNILLQQQNNYTEKTISAGKNINLYCIYCNENHQLKRKYPYQQGSAGKNLIVTYTCSSCVCEGNAHTDVQRHSNTQKKGMVNTVKDWCTGNNAKTGSRDLVVELTPYKLLQLAEDNVSQTIKEHSIPGYKVQKDEYLTFLNFITENKYRELVQDLKYNRYHSYPAQETRTNNTVHTNYY